MPSRVVLPTIDTTLSKFVLQHYKNRNVPFSRNQSIKLDKVWFGIVRLRERAEKLAETFPEAQALVELVCDLEVMLYEIVLEAPGNIPLPPEQTGRIVSHYDNEFPF